MISQVHSMGIGFPRAAAKLARPLCRHSALLLAWMAFLMPVSAEPHKPPLRVAYTSVLFYDVNENDATVATKLWVTRLAETYLAEMVEGNQTSTFSGEAEAIELLKSKSVDIICMSPVEFLAASKKTPLEALYMAASHGNPGFSYAVLVRADSGIDRLEDLGGATVRVDPGGIGNVMTLWLERELLSRDLGMPDQFFGNMVKASRISQAAMPVFFEQADACVIPFEAFGTMVELNPQMGRDLKVIEQSSMYPRGYVCVPADMDPAMKEGIRSAIANMHTEPSGRQMMMMFYVDELIPPIPEFDESLVDLIADHQRLTERRVRASASASAISNVGD